MYLTLGPKSRCPQNLRRCPSHSRACARRSRDRTQTTSPYLFASRQRSGWHLVAKMCTALCSIAAWKWPVEARVSWIAPEQLGRFGRKTAHSMRRNDDGGGHVAPRATWHVPRAAAWTLRKMLCQGWSPNGKWPGAQTFRSEAPWSELRDIGRISPEGSKLCPQGVILLFSAFRPLARTPLDLGTPNLLHGCTWARAIRICIT